MKHTVVLGIAAFVLIGLAGCDEDQPPVRSRETIRAVCAADIEKLCAGEDRIGRCLRRNETELSEECKAVLGERGSRR